MSDGKVYHQEKQSKHSGYQVWRKVGVTILQRAPQEASWIRCYFSSDLNGGDDRHVTQASKRRMLHVEGQASGKALRTEQTECAHIQGAAWAGGWLSGFDREEVDDNKVERPAECARH